MSEGAASPPAIFSLISFSILKNFVFNNFGLVYTAASLKAKNIKDLSIAGYGRDFKVDLAIKDITLF